MAKKKKKRDTVYLQYKCKDNSVTVANTASIGLMYWYGRITPQPKIENPQPFSVHVVSISMPSPYNPLFLSLVIAGIERTLGKAPEIAPELLEPEYCKRFAKVGFAEIEKQLKAGTPEVVAYEQVCLDILNWLKDEGEITALLLDEPMQLFSW